MILKNADDKSSQLAQLEQWLADRTLNAAQRQWLTDELFRLRMGIQGEREAAFYLDSYFKDSENHVVIHDLRVEVNEPPQGGSSCGGGSLLGTFSTAC